jgi:hypothetical protein
VSGVAGRADDGQNDGDGDEEEGVFEGASHKNQLLRNISVIRTGGNRVYASVVEASFKANSTASRDWPVCF